jgi:hypothetical protein
MQCAIHDLSTKLSTGEVFGPSKFALWFEENWFLKHADKGQTSNAKQILAKVEAIPNKRRAIYYKRFKFYDLDGTGEIDETEAHGLLTNIWLELMVTPLAQLGRDNNTLMQKAIQELTGQIEEGVVFNVEQFSYWFEYRVYLPLTATELPEQLLHGSERPNKNATTVDTVEVSVEALSNELDQDNSHAEGQSALEKRASTRDRGSSSASDLERNGSIGGDLATHLAVARAAACDSIPLERSAIYASRFDFNDLDGSGLIDSAEEATALVTSLWLELMAGPIAQKGGDNYSLMEEAVGALVAAIEAGETYSTQSFSLWFEHEIYLKHMPEETGECLSPVTVGPDHRPLFGSSSDMDEVKAIETCVICLENPINCVFVPCGHLAVCLSCSKQMALKDGCPICRVPIQQVVKTFKAT